MAALRPPLSPAEAARAIFRPLSGFPLSPGSDCRIARAMAIAKKRPFSLPLVHQDEQLSGATLIAFERLARTAKPGSDQHRGVLRTCRAISQYVAQSCMPPAARAATSNTSDAVDRWLDGGSTDDVKKARNEGYNALPEAEQRTVDALAQSMAASKRKKLTALDEHADSVVLRYTALAANYATSTVLLTADAVDDPGVSVLVPQQAAGALAYLHAGLGPARNSDLRSRAWDQAEWESERRSSANDNVAFALSIQIFHEYLGSYWKDQSDAQRAYLDDFIAWAIAVRS